MINALATLLGFQLVGEVLARMLALPVPGPVLGAVLLAAVLFLRPSILEGVSETARGVLRHLSLLFVPAAVGVTEHRDLMAEHGLALLLALVASTVLALVAAGLVFRWVSRS